MAGAGLWWSPSSKLRCLTTRTAPQTSSIVSVSKVSTCKSRSLCFVSVQLMLVPPGCHGPKVAISLTHLIQFFLMASKGHSNKGRPLLTFSTGESQELRLHRPGCQIQGPWKHKSGPLLGSRDTPAGVKKVSMPRRQLSQWECGWVKRIGGKHGGTSGGRTGHLPDPQRKSRVQNWVLALPTWERQGTQLVGSDKWIQTAS